MLDAKQYKKMAEKNFLTIFTDHSARGILKRTNKIIIPIGNGRVVKLTNSHKNREFKILYSMRIEKKQVAEVKILTLKASEKLRIATRLSNIIGKETVFDAMIMEKSRKHWPKIQTLNRALGHIKSNNIDWMLFKLSYYNVLYQSDSPTYTEMTIILESFISCRDKPTPSPDYLKSFTLSL